MSPGGVEKALVVEDSCRSDLEGRELAEVDSWGLEQEEESLLQDEDSCTQMEGSC